MKKSIGLLSALVVSTMFIVNCQKAPDKRRVRPSGDSGAGAQTDVVGEKAKLPTKVCGQEILTEYKTFGPLYTKASKARVTDSSTAEEIKAIQTDLANVLVKCKNLIPALEALGEAENYGCLKDNGVKSEENSLTKAQVQQWCNYAGTILKKDHNHPNEFSDAAEADQKAKTNAKEVESKFLGKNFKISEEALNMMYEGRTNLGSFLVEGEVKTAQSSLDQALAASQTVCTAIGKGIAKDQVLASPVLKFTSFEKADKSNLKDIAIEFKGQATMVNITLEEKQSDEETEVVTTAGALLCLNLEFDKLSVAQLETVFGKAITVAPTKVTTEVTGGTTNTTDKLAAAQPEGSPQQKQLEVAMAPTVKKEAEQKAANEKAAQEKAAADKKAADEKAAQEKQEKKAKEAAEAKAAEAKAAAKEAQKPAVTLVPATGVSSPAAAAKVEAEGKATQEELASMKEKAERLEKEAKDAEAEVTKLETEKAKAEDIDQAKAKARIARESANSAKAEYDAAAKQA